MNTTTVKALSQFSHGEFTATTGDVLEMPTAVANELAAAGLVQTITEKASKSAKAPAKDAQAATTQGQDDDDAEDATAKPSVPVMQSSGKPGAKIAKTLDNKAE